MDLTLTAEQTMLVDAARRFLARAWSLADTRAAERDPRGFRPDAWREMAGLGWHGMELPAAYGGGGPRVGATIPPLPEKGGGVPTPPPPPPPGPMPAPLLLPWRQRAQAPS